jgi:hypothetical protein
MRERATAGRVTRPRIPSAGPPAARGRELTHLTRAPVAPPISRSPVGGLVVRVLADRGSVGRGRARRRARELGLRHCRRADDLAVAHPFRRAVAAGEVDRRLAPSPRSTRGLGMQVARIEPPGIRTAATLGRRGRLRRTGRGRTPRASGSSRRWWTCGRSVVPVPVRGPAPQVRPRPSRTAP